MEQRAIGQSDLTVSSIGLGCNNFGRVLDLAGTRAVLDRAFDLGITLLDTGDVYGRRGGAETLMGELLGPRRKQVVIATKFGKPMDTERKTGGASRAYVFQAVEASLARLKTDWIDLYQLHEPDPLTSIEETLAALADLKQQGKIRHIGCSTCRPSRSRRRSAPPRRPASPASSAARTSTACSTARPSAPSFPRWNATA